MLLGEAAQRAVPGDATLSSLQGSLQAAASREAHSASSRRSSSPWLAALAILGWFVQRQLVVGADLRLFLPSPTTPEQRLLLEEVGEGPASRVLAIALDGAPPEQLADISRELSRSAARQPRVPAASRTASSRSTPCPTSCCRIGSCCRRRSIRSASTRSTCTPSCSHARAISSSPAGSFLEPWLPRDPTLEMLKLLQRWQPMQEPRREYDVWFDRDGRRALLVAETQAPAFDPDRQRAALEELDARWRLRRTALRCR